VRRAAGAALPAVEQRLRQVPRCARAGLLLPALLMLPLLHRQRRLEERLLRCVGRRSLARLLLPRVHQLLLLGGGCGMLAGLGSGLLLPPLLRLRRLLPLLLAGSLSGLLLRLCLG
jgi:hypothetical protein